MTDDRLFPAEKAEVLDDAARLELLSEADLARLLELEGWEDIADLGSGTGFYTNRVAAWTSGKVYAVELQEDMQRRHRERGMPPNVVLIQADLEQLPLAEGSLDRAMSIITFHEAHGSGGLERLARAMRPGGCLVVVDWQRAPEAADRGPALEMRLTKEEVAFRLLPWFDLRLAEDLGRYLFAVVAVRRETELAAHLGPCGVVHPPKT